MVVALMQSLSTRPVKTFSIGFSEPEYNEAGYAARVAEHLGTEHHELYVTPKQALDVVEDLPTIYDEPFSDPSQVPTYLVCKLAHWDVKVVLSGDGGDETFAGYKRYQRCRARWQRLHEHPPVTTHSEWQSAETDRQYSMETSGSAKPVFGSRRKEMATQDRQTIPVRVRLEPQGSRSTYWRISLITAC